ncbi:hypothetical protein EXIGLDRAFT_765592 [Exidia glandulosa HHB12029]|uniref:Helicase C-terminal domain-containing protein n=1 Tax=Exidia glandulosa HHB12029 TaxID=1314781 RepID=A0A165KEN7_EXIGL|nr:hypothetical protein EXIGLDRAFT_765592 [Exidia glandulosa HHB12029]
MASTACPVCCTDCRGRVHAQAYDSPWLLSNYLQAGTVYIDCATPPVLPCTHEHASDGHHTASAPTLLPLAHMGSGPPDLLDAIIWLVHERFAAVTMTPIASRVRLRIYLIPHDLPKTSGALLRRGADVLSKAAEHLTQLLRCTSRRPVDWYGQTASPPTEADFFIHAERDNRTLSEIFSQLSSSAELPDDSLSSPPAGLRSQLYRYQEQTLARMLQLESGDNAVPDPTFLPVHSVLSETTFHIQPSTMTVRSSVPLFSPRRSGILCEDMGSGKSCILLALILATKGKLPRLDQECTLTTPVVTPVSVRRFPWIRDALSSPVPLSTDGAKGVPSLTNLMLDFMRLKFSRALTMDEENRLDSAGLLRPLLYNSPYYFSVPLPTFLHESRRSPRKGRKTIDESGPRKFYLASATLVVVPATLFKQWCLEIEKHCDDRALKCLRLSTKDDILPSPTRLGSYYDLILITHERFAAELKSAQGVGQPVDWNCSCPPLPQSDVPDCSCGTGLTPLVQCHWKRIVIDEGHSLSNSQTHLASLADLLRSDSVWVVSGTPTTNLIGLGFSESSKNDFYAVEETPLNEGDVLRGSTREERGDLAKLEGLLVNFLHLPQITQELGSYFFRKHVAAPFLRRVQREDGTWERRFGATRVMEQVMQQCMVRHRIEEIETEVGLPPATKEVVRLDLHPMAALTYNVILALVAGNAVDSDRRDQDYFFHSNNRGALNTVMQNLSQSLFWHADAQDLHTDMARHVKRSREILQKALDQGKDEDDVILSRAALSNLELAQNDLVWMPMMKRLQVFVPFSVTGLPEDLRSSWTMQQAEGPLPETCLSSDRTTYMHPDKLVALRSWIHGHPFDTLDGIAAHGKSLDQVDSAQLQKLEDSRKDRSSKAKKRKRQDGLEFKEQQKIVLGRKVAPSRSDAESLATVPCSSSSLLRNHPLRHVTVGASMSSKMNFVLREVLTHKEDKFLIFSSSPLSLAHMGEALSVARVSHLKIMSQVDPARWSGYAANFQSSDSCQCLLMEIKYGARGLNLTRANRIIFLEPVWRADEESQAVKRAHRIGQTKPISIKILAVRGTVEEAMISRRTILQHSAEQQPKSMLDETGMRSYIEASNPTFLDVGDQSKNSTNDLFEIPLLSVASEGDGEDENADSLPAPKRVRIVRFAD